MKLKTPCYVELESVNDVARLACALERVPLPVFSLTLHNDSVLAVQTDLLMGRPVLYYAKFKGRGEFLAYRNAGGIEDVTVVDAITNPTFSYSPIIQVEKLPANLMKSVRASKPGCISIKLKDATSLAKVSGYKIFYDEATLPLFLFKDDKHVLGTFMDMGEDGASSFYYVTLEGAPSETFMKYSSQKAEKAAFTNKVDEHGYIYMKVIRLRKDHPLVMLHD